MTGIRILMTSLCLSLAACSGAGTDAASDEEAQEPGLFVVVHIPVSIEPMERGSKYEDPLDAALRAQGLGEVSGGGTLLGAPRPDGSSEVESVDIDVDLVDAERGLPALRAELKKLNPPQGTELSYEDAAGKPVKEIL
jgi:hypothetical protein